MKKTFLFSTMAVFISMGFVSCKKCQKCTRSSSPTITICEKDYNSNTEYGLALDAYQATGYTCKNKTL